MFNEYLKWLSNVLTVPLFIGSLIGIPFLGPLAYVVLILYAIFEGILAGITAYKDSIK